MKKLEHWVKTIFITRDGFEREEMNRVLEPDFKRPFIQKPERSYKHLVMIPKLKPVTEFFSESDLFAPMDKREFELEEVTIVQTEIYREHS